MTTPEQNQIFVAEIVSHSDPLLAVMRAMILPSPELGNLPARIAETMMERPDIQAAIEALKKKRRAEPVEITQRTIAEDHEAVYREAFKDRDFKACVAAKNAQAEILGLKVQKIEVTRKREVGEYTTAELEAMLAKAGGQMKLIENPSQAEAGGEVVKDGD